MWRHHCIYYQRCCWETLRNIPGHWTDDDFRMPFLSLPCANAPPSRVCIQDAFIMKISVSRVVADVPLGNSCFCYVASLEKAWERTGGRGEEVSVNAPATNTRASVCSGVHTHAHAISIVASVPSTEGRARSRTGAHFYSMSRCTTYFDVRNGCALGLCQRDRQSGWNRRLRSRRCVSR